MSTTLTTALDCVPLLTGAGAPTVGMLPAKAVPESTHAKAIAIANRFMVVTPFQLRKCQTFYIVSNRTTTQETLQGASRETTIAFAVDRILNVRKSQVDMRTASPKLDLSHLTANDRALHRCRSAFEFRDRGEYDAAQEVMRPLWKRVGDHPTTEGLYPSVAAEVLLCVGALTGWIGSRNEVKESDCAARDLLTESITLYESLGDFKKVAEARTELAYCYWRAGALDEARIMFNEALERLTTEGNTRANALIGLSVVEWAASRYEEALKILTDNTPLFLKITSHTLRGTYHNQLGITLEEIAASKKRAANFHRAVKQYQEADHHFKLANNPVFQTHVKNNIANILRELRRFREAHHYLEQARRLTVYVRDKVRTAQIDETRAQVFIAERKYAQAELTARTAAKSFEKSGRQCFLAEALTTQGIALTRLGQTERAQFTFQKAIEVAHQAGALNKAGLAALTLIEEIDHLPSEVVSAAYAQAAEWLADSQNEDISLRLKVVRKNVPFQSGDKTGEQDTIELLFQ